MRVLPAFILLAMVFAGCSDSSVGTAAPQAAIGTLRGVVVDEAVRPLAGVNVTLLGTAPQNVTTKADGEFRFDDVATGGHLLEARKKGFIDTRLDVQVFATNVTDPVRVILLADRAEQSFIEAHTFDGFLECSFTAFYARAACSPDIGPGPLCQPYGVCLPNATAPGQYLAAHTISQPRMKFMQSEMVWSSSQLLGETLRAVPGARNANGQIIDFIPYEGSSPLVMPIDVNLAQGAQIGSGSDYIVRVFAGYVNGTAPPQCVPTLGCPWGVGAAIQQPFELFTHVFYGFTPPPGWQFGRDGLPPLP